MTFFDDCNLYLYAESRTCKNQFQIYFELDRVKLALSMYAVNLSYPESVNVVDCNYGDVRFPVCTNVFDKL